MHGSLIISNCFIAAQESDTAEGDSLRLCGLPDLQCKQQTIPAFAQAQTYPESL